MHRSLAHCPSVHPGSMVRNNLRGHRLFPQSPSPPRTRFRLLRQDPSRSPHCCWAPSRGARRRRAPGQQPRSGAAAAPAPYAAPGACAGAGCIHGGAGLGPRTFCTGAGVSASRAVYPPGNRAAIRFHGKSRRTLAAGCCTQIRAVTDAAATPHAPPGSARPRPPCLQQPWKSRLNRWQGGARAASESWAWPEAICPASSASPLATLSDVQPHQHFAKCQLQAGDPHELSLLPTIGF